MNTLIVLILLVSIIVSLVSLYYYFTNRIIKPQVVIKGNFIPTIINPSCGTNLSKKDLILPFYQESNLRNTMKRLNINPDYPITDYTAPMIASHLTNYGYTFNKKCSSVARY